MAQWWKCSPPTNVSWVRFPNPASYVGWIGCWFSTLLQEVFSGYYGFPSPWKPTFPYSNSILGCTDISERVLVNSLVLRGKQITLHYVLVRDWVRFLPNNSRPCEDINRVSVENRWGGGGERGGTEETTGVLQASVLHQTPSNVKQR